MYEDRYQTGNRDAWEFEFTGGSLAKSAASRLKYHSDRENHWAKAAASTEAAIREKGVTLEERGVTGGTQFVAKVDSALGTRLGEERGKCEKHRNLGEQFEGFIHEFKRTPDRIFKLKLSDMRFFGVIGEMTRFGDEEL